jgi:hypothetical protein
MQSKAININREIFQGDTLISSFLHGSSPLSHEINISECVYQVYGSVMKIDNFLCIQRSEDELWKKFELWKQLVKIYKWCLK